MPNVWGVGGSREGKYKRHSVDRDVEEFVGWPTLTKIFEAAYAKSKIFGSFTVCLFKEGSRVSEALQSRREMFKVEDDFIWVNKLPVCKRYGKVDSWIEERREKPHNILAKLYAWNEEKKVWQRKRWETERIELYRIPFPIHLKEPFSLELWRWISTTEGLLFPSPYTDKSYSKQWAYHNLIEVGEQLGMELYNHWFRAQRASQLGEDYDYDPFDFRNYFRWEKMEMCLKYVKRSKALADKMRGKW